MQDAPCPTQSQSRAERPDRPAVCGPGRRPGRRDRAAREARSQASGASARRLRDTDRQRPDIARPEWLWQSRPRPAAESSSARGGRRRRSREDTTPLLENKDLAIADIYVPAKRRRTLKQATVDALAESIMEDGLKVPILVREDGSRYVLVEGLHRLEACKALGEEVIACTMVQARS